MCWANFFGYMFSFLFTQYPTAKRWIFTTALQKGKSNPVLMYIFHYDYIKNIYDNKSKLLFKDTVSLMYEIKTEDVYEDFSSDKEMFDFSHYSTKSEHYDNSHKLVIGKN